jgi:peptide deformylase
MLISHVVTEGHPVLRQRALVDAVIGPDTDNLIKLMRDTIMYRQDAIAISAPQVSYSVPLFVTKCAEIPVVISPKILQRDTEMETELEGCLSFPNVFVPISRPKEIEVAFVDASGRPRSMFLTGIPARVFQHEFDHLEGRLISDYAENKKRVTVEARGLLLHRKETV